MIKRTKVYKLQSQTRYSKSRNWRIYEFMLCFSNTSFLKLSIHSSQHNELCIFRSQIIFCMLSLGLLV